MPKIALIKVESYWHYNKDTDMVKKSISDWHTVTDQELVLLKQYCRNSPEYFVIEQIELHSLNKILTEMLQYVKEQEEKRKQEEEKAKVRKEKAALKQKLKTEQEEKELFEKLKEKFGQNNS